MMRYDIAVIGAGSAGLVAALTANRAGKHVAMLEKRKFWRGVYPFRLHSEQGLYQQRQGLACPRALRCPWATASQTT